MKLRQPLNFQTVPIPLGLRLKDEIYNLSAFRLRGFLIVKERKL